MFTLPHLIVLAAIHNNIVFYDSNFRALLYSIIIGITRSSYMPSEFSPESSLSVSIASLPSLDSAASDFLSLAFDFVNHRTMASSISSSVPFLRIRCLLGFLPADLLVLFP